jgi:lysyl-tRNA synthetase class I
MFSVPNESNSQQQKFVNIGLLRGVSDTIIVLPNKVLFVEFKTEKGYQSEFQKDFQERVTKLGHEYYVIRNLEQFKELIYVEIPTTNLHNKN